MQKGTYFPIVRAFGTNYEIGFTIGKEFKERIQKTFEISVKFKELKKFDKKFPERIDKVEFLTKKNFPNYIQEIEGMADGSNLNYRDVLVLNFRDIPLKENSIEGCSTIIFKDQQKIVLAHNEDYESVIGKYSYLMFVELNNGIKFFSHAYPGCLPGCSFGYNSFGIVYSMNSMTNPVNKIGFSRYILGRSILEAKNLEEAVNRLIKFAPRCGGSSYNLASLKEKRVLNLESTAEDYCLTEINDRYFHTNHHISEKFRDFPIPKFSTSLVRYKRGMQLIPNVEKSEERAIQILRDKHIFINSLKDADGTQADTICTAIFDISKSISVNIYPHDLEINNPQFFSNLN